jgi:hypothetical protein
VRCNPYHQKSGPRHHIRIRGALDPKPALFSYLHSRPKTQQENEFNVVSAQKVPICWTGPREAAPQVRYPLTRPGSLTNLGKPQVPFDPCNSVLRTPTIQGSILFLGWNQGNSAYQRRRLRSLYRLKSNTSSTAPSAVPSRHIPMV